MPLSLLTSPLLPELVLHPELQDDRLIGPLLAELLLLLTLRQRTVIIHVLRDCKQEHQSAVVSAVKITHSRPDVLFGGAEAGLNNG